MADRDLRIRIGAAVDASFTTVLSSVVEAVKRARKQIQSDMNASTRSIVAAQRQASKEVSADMKSQAKTSKQVADSMVKDVDRAAKERVRLEKQAMTEVERDLRRHNAERLRQAREIEREESRIARQRQRAIDGAKAAAGRIAGTAMRTGAVALYAGTRLASSVMHGMGMDVGVQSQLHESVSREALATDVAAQGYIGSGKGPAGSQTYSDPKDVLASASQTGIETGTDTKEVLEGLNRFVRMTGDLKSAREAMGEIGKVAKANGAEFGDMMEAAANVSIAMGDIDNKGEHLATIMRVVAGQGHLGAVTIKDLASQMGKLTGQANFFQIDPMSKATLEKSGVTNDVTQRVAVMGALAQYARAKGGRITAQQATQASMAFIRDMTNRTELKRMAGQGISTFTDASQTKIRDPLQVLLEVFKKAQRPGGINLNMLKELFPNQQSRAVANAVAMDYDAQYKKAAERGITDETKRHQFAMENVTDSFQNYLRVTQSNVEVGMKFAKQMETADSQSKVFNNQMGLVADQLRQQLLPALIAVTPALIDLAKGMLNFVHKIVGGDTTEQTETYGMIKSSGDAADALDAKLGGSTKKTGRKVYDFATGQMVDEFETPGATKIDKKEVDELGAKRKDIEARIRAKEAAIRAAGEKGSGLLGKNTKYKDMNDDELRAQVNSKLGDSVAEGILTDKAQIEQLSKTMNQIDSSLEHLKMLEKLGRVIEVKIVEDHTQKPPGAEPVTSGTSNPNASSEP